MSENKRVAGILSALRERAEAQVQGEPEPDISCEPGEVRRLVREHRILQVAMEMQSVELRAVQCQLEKSRAHFSRLYNQAPVGFMTLGGDGIILQANQTLAGILRMDLDDLLQTPFSHFVDPRDRDTYLACFPAFFSDPSGKSLDLRLLRRGGPDLHARIEGRQEPAVFLDIQDAGSTVLLLVVRDITARKLADDQLRQSEARFRTIVETASEGIWTLDNELATVSINQHMAEMLGYSIEEMAGRRFRDFVHPEEMDDHNARVADRRQGRRGIYERRLIHRDGTARNFIVSASPLIADNGSFSGSFAMLTDITERKRAEERLRQSEENLAITLQSIGDAVISTDTQGRVMRMNPVAETLTGWTQSDAVGLPLVNIFNIISATTRQSVQNPVEVVIREGRVVGLANHTILIARDGTERQIADSGAPIQNEAGEKMGVVLVFRDVTEQVKLEEQYLQSQKMEAVGQLAGGVAHDFNNLLQVILGHLDIVLDNRLSKDSARSHLEQVSRAAQRATVLVRQLLAFSRRQTMHLQEIDLNDIVANLLKMLRRVIGEHIELEFKPGPNLKPVLADAGQIEQVLMNLAVNSRDAMSSGGGIIIETSNVVIQDGCSDTTHSIPAGEYARFTFSDTGPGIPAELHDHIFEPFFTTKEVGKGTGLGLSTVYGIVKQHQGFIELQSPPGAGVSFHITLPAAEKPVAEKPEIPAREKKENEAAACEEGTILLAEDDTMVRQLAATILNKAGYKALVASNGDEAKRLFAEHADTIDLALLDVVMPKSSGRMVAEYIRSTRPNMPILFCSGYDFNILESGLEPTGEIAIIRKPYDRRDILAKVREMLERRGKAT